ncbi:hypothetical protein ACFQH6_11930 [Halobacteriaceae archaeon GCM10025711]
MSRETSGGREQRREPILRRSPFHAPQVALDAVFYDLSAGGVSWYGRNEEGVDEYVQRLFSNDVNVDAGRDTPRCWTKAAASSSTPSRPT